MGILEPTNHTNSTNWKRRKAENQKSGPEQEQTERTEGKREARRDGFTVLSFFLCTAIV